MHKYDKILLVATNTGFLAQLKRYQELEFIISLV